MPKKPFKSFRESDANKLKSLVKQFNAKVREVSKTPTLKAAQPETIKYSEITKTIRSRAEYNRVYGVYSRYLKRGAEKPIVNESGVRITRWMRNEARYAVQRINTMRARERKHYQSLPGELRPGAFDELSLNPKTNSLRTVVSKQYADKIFKGIQRQAGVNYYSIGEEMYKENYLKSLRKHYTGIKGFKEFYEFIQNLSGRTLLDAVSQDPTFLIEYNYGFEEGEIRMTYLKEQWEDYLSTRRKHNGDFDM